MTDEEEEAQAFLKDLRALCDKYDIHTITPDVWGHVCFVRKGREFSLVEYKPGRAKVRYGKSGLSVPNESASFRWNVKPKD